MKKIIADLPKNRRETIRVELDEYQGKQLFSVRTWFLDDEGNLRPSGKGLSLDVRHLPALRQAIDDAERAAREAALL